MVENLFLEVIRAFYSYCHDVLGPDLRLSYTQSGNLLTRYELSCRSLSPRPLFSMSPAVLRGQAGPGQRTLGCGSDVIQQRPLDLLYTSGEAQGEGDWKMGGRERAQK